MSNINTTHTSRQRDWFDLLAITLVVITIGFAALSYGGVEPQSVLVLTALGAVLSVLSCVQIGRGRFEKPLLMPLAILVAFAFLVLTQTLPLPVSMVDWLSPERVEAAAAGRALDQGWCTISYYPLTTSLGLRLLLIGVSVFVTIGLTVRSLSSTRALLLGLFAVGSAEAALALAQIVTKAEGIYWSSVSIGGLRSGSFINHSNFSQFLNLTAAAGLGALLITLSQNRDRRRARVRVSATFIDLLRVNWYLFAGLALHAVAIAASLSRGGMLGMGVATLVVAFVMHRQKNLGRRAWLLFAVPPLAFGGAVLVGFDAIYERLGTLEQRDSYADRWELGAASLRAAGDHWLVGAGLDAYQYVFPQYDTTNSAALAEQADNDYAQLLVEVGLAGAILVAAFLFLVARTAYDRLSNRSGHACFAAYSAVYGLAAIAVQSVSDFGQRVPAAFLVTAALCGLCFTFRPHKQDPTSQPRGALRWGVAGLSLLVIVPSAVWALQEAVADYKAAEWFAITRDLEEKISDPRSEQDIQDYIDLVASAEQASEIRPNNIDYAFWLNEYRWRLMVAVQGVDEQTLAETEEGQAIALQIADELRKVREICPTFGPAYTVEGDLRLLAADKNGVALVLRGAELNPNNPRALLAAARAQAASGGEANESARQQLLHCVSISRSSFQAAARLCLEELGQPKWARELAGEDLTQLASLEQLLKQREGGAGLLTEVSSTLSRLREERAFNEEASADELAQLAEKRTREGKLKEALKLYRRALGAKYSSLKWRLALADVLASLQRLEEAEREARIALRIHPGSQAAREKLEEISLLVPASSGSDAKPESE